MYSTHFCFIVLRVQKHVHIALSKNLNSFGLDNNDCRRDVLMKFIFEDGRDNSHDDVADKNSAEATLSALSY